MSSVSSSNTLEATIVCVKCQSTLVTDFISGNKSTETVIRCGHCGELWSPVEILGTRDKDAWRSLWLGLSSILLVFITGIPALYYGIRSLSRTRFTRIRLRDRRAAVAGVTLGTLFGVFGSLCVFGIAGAILVNQATKIETTTNEQALNVFDGLATIDLPPELAKFKSKKFLGSSTFKFTDKEAIVDRCIRFDLVFYPPIMSGSVSTIEKQLANNYLVEAERDEDKGKMPEYEETDDYELRWNVFSKPTVVRKRSLIEKWPDGTLKHVTHFDAYRTARQGTYGMSLQFRAPHDSFDEEKVKAMFESLTPREDLRVDAAWSQVAKENAASASTLNAESEEAGSLNK